MFGVGITPSRAALVKFSQPYLRSDIYAVTTKTHPSIKSWDEAKKNPDAAVDAAMKAKADLNRQSTKDQMMVDFELMDSPNVKGRTGFGDERDWKQTIELLKKYRGLETTSDWTAFHTNDFVTGAVR
jgi:ABC-type nitrate/sulfonate/bicarbonate transport system substrate-binding protein